MPDLPGRLSGKCDGIERHPNPCTCPCEGCKYHCSQHVEPGRVLSPRAVRIIVWLPPWVLLTGLSVGYWLGGHCG